VDNDTLPILLSRKQVAQYTGISIKTVEQWLASLGVQPIDMGGRRYALKWHRDAVSQALWTLHSQSQTATLNRTPTHPVLGKSIKELDALLRKG